MTDLKELLESQIAQQPHDAGDAQAAIRAGQRQVRTRRAAVVVGSAAVAAAAAALTVALPEIGGDTGTPATGMGRTVEVADATPAVPGRDYDELSTLETQQTYDEQGNGLPRRAGHTIWGYTDDGRLLYVEGETFENGVRQPMRLALVDPATGVKDFLADAPDYLHGPLSLGADRMLLSGDQGEWSYDRLSEKWRLVRRTDVPSGAPEPTGTDTKKVWVEANQIHVRDEATGKEHAIRSGGPTCHTSLKATTEKWIVVTDYCTAKPATDTETTEKGIPSERHVRVFKYDGEPVVAIEGTDGFADVSEDLLAISHEEGRTEDGTPRGDSGSYVYEFATGDWLLLERGAPPGGPDASAYVDHDQLVWTTELGNPHAEREGAGTIVRSRIVEMTD